MTTNNGGDDIFADAYGNGDEKALTADDDIFPSSILMDMIAEIDNGARDLGFCFFLLRWLAPVAVIAGVTIGYLKLFGALKGLF